MRQPKFQFGDMVQPRQPPIGSHRNRWPFKVGSIYFMENLNTYKYSDGNPISYSYNESDLDLFVEHPEPKKLYAYKSGDEIVFSANEDRWLERKEIKMQGQVIERVTCWRAPEYDINY